MSSKEKIMERIKQWAGMFIVALALAVLLTRLDGAGTESADAASTKILWLGSASFVPTNEEATWTLNGSYFVGSGFFFAPINLPAGKKIEGITFDYLDNAPSDDLCAAVWVDPVGLASVSEKVIGCSSGYLDSLASLKVALSPPYTLKSSDIPFVMVHFDTHSTDLRMYNVGIRYK
jgi:hypothetical protein